MKNAAPFDPFDFSEARMRAARSWLIATGIQALITCALLLGARFTRGTPYELHANLIVCMGIVATWSLALRTIRERLLELIAFWQKASRGLLKRASESGRHLISKPLNPKHEDYIKGSIRRLRIIATGLTIPFFALPLLWTFISVFLSLQHNRMNADVWMPVACLMLFSAAVVAGYLHWAIVPLPKPIRVSATPFARFKRRRR